MVPCMCLMVGMVVSKIFSRATKGIRHTLIGLKEDDQPAIESESSNKNDTSISSIAPSDQDTTLDEINTTSSGKKKRSFMPIDVAVLLIAITVYQVRYYILHETYVSANVLSNPTIIQYAGTLH